MTLTATRAGERLDEHPETRDDAVSRGDALAADGWHVRLSEAGALTDWWPAWGCRLPVMLRFIPAG